MWAMWREGRRKGRRGEEVKRQETRGGGGRVTAELTHDNDVAGLDGQVELLGV